MGTNKELLEGAKLHGNTISKQKRLNVRQKRFLTALRQNAAYNITKACEVSKIDRQLHYYWLKTNETYKKLFDEVSEEQIDWVETNLMKNIKEGNVAAQIFFLKTRGKGRGYVEGIQVDIRKKVATDDLSDLSNDELENLAATLSDYLK